MATQTPTGQTGHRYYRYAVTFGPLIITTAIIGLITAIMTLQDRALRITERVVRQQAELVDIVARLNSELHAHLSELGGKETPGVGELSQRVAALESLISQSPAKAITVPLLQKDLESFRQTSNMQIQAIKESISTTTDLVKLLLAALVASLVPSIIKAVRTRPQE